MENVEFAVLDWIQAHLRCGFLDAVLPFITNLSNHGEIWIALAVVLVLFRRTRRAGWTLGGGLLLDLLLCNMFLKPLVNRLRPFQVRPGIELLVQAPGDASFPSGHTAVSFAAVFALWSVGSPLWKPALVLAVTIAFSRLYLYVHWPSDVLGGVVVGAVAGCAAGAISKAIARWMESRRETDHG